MQYTYVRTDSTKASYSQLQIFVLRLRASASILIVLQNDKMARCVTIYAKLQFRNSGRITRRNKYEAFVVFFTGNGCRM